ncbi:SAV_2336 N-terminal domain-related protein [Streptomyces sp. NPDC102467]|uniref:SAV_2336 N-terminal domain-related protein n=1 Tax=Streptomyces sp. NPDC102467 TaxID=3366179 RepID=UPI0037F91BCE
MSAKDAGALLTALAQRLRQAELDPLAGELADAVWLARHLGESSGTPVAGEARPVLPPDVPGAPGTPPSPPPAPPGQASSGGGSERLGGPATGRLFVPTATADSAHGLRTAAVRVPAAPALPDALGLQRALRPLQHYRPPGRRPARLLDEEATAELAARADGLLVPVLRPRRRREARLLLVMDMSTSTVVWRQALDELRDACERAGAFRDVQVHFLFADSAGRPGHTPMGGSPARLRDPRLLADPTGHRITLLLSDCAGPMWRSGHIQQLLHAWAQSAPVAVVQPLPQRMWQRTHLPARRGVLHRREGPARRLEFVPERGPAAHGRLPVPVLALRRSSVEGWARLMSGATGRSLRAAAGWVSAIHPASDSPVRARQDIAGAERVRAFLNQASPPARQLVVALSTVPLYLPVMRLVQHAMLADSGPEVLAEVLLSGLVRRRDEAADPDAVRYDFLPDVATALRSRLDPQDAQLLLKHCSDYVERRFGRAARNFPALAAAVLHGRVPAPGTELSAEPALGAGSGEPPGLRAFAEVSMEVLRDLAPGVEIPGGGGGGAPLEWEEVFEEGDLAFAAYLDEGETRELDRAVRLFEETLRDAAQGEQQRRAAEALGWALYQRWRARSAPDDVSRALQLFTAAPELSVVGQAHFAGVLSGLAVATDQDQVQVGQLPAELRDWARSLATEERPAKDWAAVELLRRCTDVLGATVRVDLDAAVGRGMLATTRRLLAQTHALLAWQVHLAEPGGHFPAESERAWFIDHMERCIEVAGALLEDDAVAGRQVRAEAHLHLADLYAGELVLDGADGVDAAATVRHAEAAREDYRAVVDALGDEPGESLSEAHLGLARAGELLGDAADESAAELRRALDAAGEAPELRYEPLSRIAALYGGLYRSDADQQALDLSVAAYAQTLELLGEDDHRRHELLQDYSEMLLERATLELSQDSPDATYVYTAVEALREVVAATPADGPDLPYHRMRLGHACLTRYMVEGVVTDLHEADWILAEAARGFGFDRPVLRAQCLGMRADAAIQLAARTGRRGQLRSALSYLAEALEAARETDEADLVAGLLGSRGGALFEIGRKPEAEAAFQEALALVRDPDLRAVLEADRARLLPPEAAPAP